MFKYLIYTKGQLSWHRWGTYVESLATVKKRLLLGSQRGFSLENDILVLESQSPFECVYRLKKFDGKKWHNSLYIDIFQDIYAFPICKYVEANIKEYMRFRAQEESETGDVPSFIEWATHNDESIRRLIFWLYENNYVTIFS